ncbi:hypothetical protein SPRG_00137 [Saprolegnia parasitica CBS 223.65]|uniref:EF-hand domain-containing protein n=1 Tax=Saprolegnia parasitica (strain CBS 223.65) TaxID=695850 RepID=A0A067D1C6_SAPPC|nr:hypothetical protein SPRG_00137 [Saprolegnia parasitica CBS 223.65]KDO35290.1 hypothetical protein SPRG_00137 [Saprolegnia parasitica CBS 223.65]|eukprot:XP_012193638.1 hypothetical protein SPRG_00137 [Saprolegnia parasitica CBS 223.65]
MRVLLRKYMGRMRLRRRARRLSERKKDAVTDVATAFDALSIEQKEAVIARVLASHKKDFNLEKHFADADVNKDGVLTTVEFHSYITSRFLPQTIAASLGHSSLERPSARQLRLVMLASGIPFIGFGIVDNLIMLTAGDSMETYLRAAMPISVLAAAGLSNCVADVAGLSLGGVIESFARKLGIGDPQLSSTQARMPIVRGISYLSSAVGISFGCLVGMLPLAFMDTEDEEAEAANLQATKERYQRIRVRSMSRRGLESDETAELG